MCKGVTLTFSDYFCCCGKDYEARVELAMDHRLHRPALSVTCARCGTVLILGNSVPVTVLVEDQRAERA